MRNVHGLLFSGPRCPACKQLKGILGDKVFADFSYLEKDVSTPEGTQLATKWSVRSLPTLILFRDNEPFSNVIGAPRKEFIMEKIREAGRE